MRGYNTLCKNLLIRFELFYKGIFTKAKKRYFFTKPSLRIFFHIGFLSSKKQIMGLPTIVHASSYNNRINL